MAFLFIHWYSRSVNDYDTTIEESSNANALADSLQQFRIISELGCFKDTPFIVFLNKIDLLPEKLKRAPLSKVSELLHQWPTFNRFSKILTPLSNKKACPMTKLKKLLPILKVNWIYVLFLIFQRLTTNISRLILLNIIQLVPLIRILASKYSSPCNALSFRDRLMLPALCNLLCLNIVPASN